MEILTDEERRVSCIAFLTKDPTILSSILTDDEIAIWSQYYHQHMEESRRERYKSIVAKVMYHMGSTKGKDIINQINTDGLSGQYIDGDESGLLSYFNNTGLYLLSGFSSKGSPQSSSTNSEVRDMLISIIES